MRIIAPAKAWANLSSFPSVRKLKPQEERVIRTSMVRIVVRPKARVTRTTPNKLCLAAGYMRRGISGSQGPKTKMVKRIQGVIEGF